MEFMVEIHASVRSPEIRAGPVSKISIVAPCTIGNRLYIPASHLRERKPPVCLNSVTRKGAEKKKRKQTLDTI
jgi:hypothetical protein